ncbi:hypothetical protein QCA50_006231 [Cerrena zonata]|uniref:Uncharacterized protein n=1 Tax=Cerrena zonata TaxID=2478898 RepID=A0AAW0GLP6_9APHY
MVGVNGVLAGSGSTVKLRKKGEIESPTWLSREIQGWGDRGKTEFRTSLLSAQTVLFLPLLAIDNVEDDGRDDPHAPPAPRLEPLAVVVAVGAADGPESTPAPAAILTKPANPPVDVVKKAEESR